MITRLELTENFALQAERERYRRGLTQRKMAVYFGMCYSGYKKLVQGRTGKIDLYNAYALFRLNQSLVLQLLGCPAEVSDIIAKLQTLPPEQLDEIKWILEEQKTERCAECYKM